MELYALTRVKYFQTITLRGTWGVGDHHCAPSGL